MKFRHMISLIMLLVFMLLLVTGVVLFIVPQGRVAYWVGWRLWGLSKEDWDRIHIISGVLFILSGSFHLYFNWRSVKHYLKDKTKKIRVFTWEFNLALMVTVLLVLGSYFLFPPVSMLHDLNSWFKDRAIKVHGEPPYGHAEQSTLKDFALKTGYDMSYIKKAFMRGGVYMEDSAQRVEEIAFNNHVSPQDLLEMIETYYKAQGFKRGDRPMMKPPKGFAYKTLPEICKDSHMSFKLAEELINLKLKVGVKKEKTMRQVAHENDTTVAHIYKIIRDVENVMTP